MEIQESKVDDVLILAMAGRLESRNWQEVEAKLLEYLASGASKILIDMAGVTYVSSAGLRIYLKLHKETKKNGILFTLCGMTDFITEVFDIAGFLPVFKVYKTREEAVQYLAGC